MFKLLCGLVLFLHVANCQGLTWQEHDESTMTGNMIGAVFCETVKDTIYTLTATGGSSLLYWLEFNPNSSPPPPIEMCNPNDEGKNSNGEVCMTAGSSFYYEVKKNYDVRACVSDVNTDRECTSNKYERINIADANTFTPLFLDVPYITYQLEGKGTSKNTTVQIVSAQDRDSNYQGSVNFTLDSTEYTELHGSLTKDPATFTTSQNIVLKKELDYETSQIHVITVYASDQGRGCDDSISARSSNTTFFLNVLDGPDQPPVFTNTNPGTTQYSAEVEENCPKGTFVRNVSAIDRDYSLDWEISYTLFNENDTFAINHSTGRITVIGDVNRESIDGYELIVQATEIEPSDTSKFGDFDGLPMSSNATVIISVIDKDDSLPKFYKSPKDKSETYNFTAFLEEETPNTLPVSNLSIYISDDDLGNNAQFTLSLTGIDSEAFTVEPEGTITNEATVTIRVKNQSKLDFETTKEFSFEIAAITNKGNTTSANVLIQLTDINDNYPKFEQDEFQANISEDSSIYQYITTIQATDADSGNFGAITYILSPNDNFDIYPDNGTVYLRNVTLDRERRSEYFVTVRATDGGGFISTAQLEIIVLDVNDIAPKFQQNQYSGNWKENQIEVEPILVYAFDNDDPMSENSNIAYEFMDEESKKNFTIETKSDGEYGEILPNGSLDTEALVGSDCSNGVIEYVLGVRAVDGGIPQNSDTVNVTLYLQDLNDFAPVFNSSYYEGYVQEESRVGTEIAIIAATDGDICKSNNQITYSVNPDSYSNLFSVEQTSGSYGVLVVKNEQIDRDVQPFYEVSVLAVDNGQDRKQANATVNVTITDKNNKNPEFDSLNSVMILENASIGAVVTIVNATDSDVNSNLTYAILHDSTKCVDENSLPVNKTLCADWFEIDTVSQEGKIKVNSKLDREDVQTVTLLLEVKDENAAEDDQIAEGTIEISISDYNDHPPKFREDPYKFNRAEGNYSTEESFVDLITANDEDRGENAEIVFTMLENNYCDIEESGRLYLNGNIDREGDPGSNFTVVVIATDQGNPQLSSNTSIVFTVDDINDNDPVFEKLEFNCTIAEEESKGTEVCTIVATDEDIGDNGNIRYDLNEETDFSVDNNGVIISEKRFDHETKTSYELKLKATDGGGDSARSSEVDLIIYIKDIDDNDPKYEKNAQQKMNITENEKIGALVGHVDAATDLDSPEFSKNYYYLAYLEEAPIEPYFTLDSKSRKLTTAVSFDRERNDSTTLYVLTSKDSNLSDVILDPNDDLDTNTSVLKILVDITDKNDEVPVFTEDLYRADIQSDSVVNEQSVVTSVQANDNDEPGVTVLQYNITKQIYENTNENTLTFGIRTVEGRGDIFIAYPIITDEGGSYLIDLEVSDGANRGESHLQIKIIVSIEQVIIESRQTVAYLNQNQAELEKDLEDILDADVVIDKIVEHGLENEPSSRATENTGSKTSDVYFHATEWNSTSLVPTETIINEIDNVANEDFLAKWIVVNLSSGTPAPADPTTENDILKSALVVVCCLIIVILVVYTTALFCISKNYQRKLRVAKASGNYVKDMEDFNAAQKIGGRQVPNTNKHMIGENPLFEENQNGNNIDIDQWYRETSDDNSIDDNAVDSQDSAIDADENGHDDLIKVGIDNEQDWEDVDIDFNEDDADTARLQAALAQRRQGGDNIVLMFDNHGMENTTM